VPFAEAVFDYLDVKYIWHVEEGQVIDVHKASTQKPGEAPPSSSSSSSSSQPPYSSGKVCVATITGKCRNILLAERTALNILSRASGVATQARQAADVKGAPLIIIFDYIPYIPSQTYIVILFCLIPPQSPLLRLLSVPNLPFTSYFFCLESSLHPPSRCNEMAWFCSRHT
jgi:hypothetical protein